MPAVVNRVVPLLARKAYAAQVLQAPQYTVSVDLFKANADTFVRFGEEQAPATRKPKVLKLTELPVDTLNFGPEKRPYSVQIAGRLLQTIEKGLQSSQYVSGDEFPDDTALLKRLNHPSAAQSQPVTAQDLQNAFTILYLLNVINRSKANKVQISDWFLHDDPLTVLQVAFNRLSSPLYRQFLLDKSVLINQYTLRRAPFFFESKFKRELSQAGDIKKHIEGLDYTRELLLQTLFVQGQIKSRIIRPAHKLKEVDANAAVQIQWQLSHETRPRFTKLEAAIFSILLSYSDLLTKIEVKDKQIAHAEGSVLQKLQKKLKENPDRVFTLFMLAQYLQHGFEQQNYQIAPPEILAADKNTVLNPADIQSYRFPGERRLAEFFNISRSWEFTRLIAFLSELGILSKNTFPLSGNLKTRAYLFKASPHTVLPIEKFPTQPELIVGYPEDRSLPEKLPVVQPDDSLAPAPNGSRRGTGFTLEELLARDKERTAVPLPATNPDAVAEFHSLFTN